MMNAIFWIIAKISFLLFFSANTAALLHIEMIVGLEVPGLR